MRRDRRRCRPGPASPDNEPGRAAILRPEAPRSLSRPRQRMPDHRTHTWLICLCVVLSDINTPPCMAISLSRRLRTRFTDFPHNVDMRTPGRTRSILCAGNSSGAAHLGSADHPVRRTCWRVCAVMAASSRTEGERSVETSPFMSAITCRVRMCLLPNVAILGLSGTAARRRGEPRHRAMRRGVRPARAHRCRNAGTGRPGPFTARTVLRAGTPDSRMDAAAWSRLSSG